MAAVVEKVVVSEVAVVALPVEIVQRNLLEPAAKVEICPLSCLVPEVLVVRAVTVARA